MARFASSSTIIRDSLVSRRGHRAREREKERERDAKTRPRHSPDICNSDARESEYAKRIRRVRGGGYIRALRHSLLRPPSDGNYR